MLPIADRVSMDEDVFRVLRTLTLQGLATLSATSLRPDVDAYLSQRIFDSLNSFGFSPVQFLPFLAANRSVISGSFVLSLLLPLGEVVPDDIDIYVPVSNRAAVTDQLLRVYGYTLDPDPVLDAYEDDDDVLDIVHFRLQDRTLDVILVRTNNVLAPITRFHSTPVMNFMSSTDIVCAYPSLTFNRCGLINRACLAGRDSDGGWVDALFKYCQRGFDLAFAPRRWAEFTRHICKEDGYCPMTLRTFSDSTTFVFSIVDLVGGRPTRAGGVIDMNTSWTLVPA
ncbi:hypothetical protein C0992_000492 [Termitomyces sp. T32_za158]|nr:hypothetical protein C0992_000492 [Termitomyces sp. T32_za158]